MLPEEHRLRPVLLDGPWAGAALWPGGGVLLVLVGLVTFARGLGGPEGHAGHGMGGEKAGAAHGHHQHH